MTNDADAKRNSHFSQNRGACIPAFLGVKQLLYDFSGLGVFYDFSTHSENTNQHLKHLAEKGLYMCRAIGQGDRLQNATLVIPLALYAFSTWAAP